MLRTILKETMLCHSRHLYHFQKQKRHHRHLNYFRYQRLHCYPAKEMCLAYFRFPPIRLLFHHRRQSRHLYLF